MKINYWDCKFENYQEFWDGEDETRTYGCKHPDKKDRLCDCNNKWGGDEAECPMAVEDTAP